ncbi:MAG: glycosyltransferase 61 family protein [Bauldia sp.]
MKDPDAAAAQRQFVSTDDAYLLQLRGKRRPFSVDRVLRGVLRLPAAAERKARIYDRRLPAPVSLGSEAPVIDDPWLAAAVRVRAERSRFEGAWRLRGDVRVDPGPHPLVFNGNRFVSSSAGIGADVEPPIWRHYARRLAGRPIMRVDRAILLRDSWDNNYWHLLHDILPRLVMAEALEIDPAIPAVVGHNFFLQHNDRLAGTRFLTERPLIVQARGQTLRCEELYLLRPGEFSSHWTPAVVDRIPRAEVAVNAGARRVFCRRKVASDGRREIANGPEIEAIFADAGFVTVDPATMTMSQQRAVFEGAEIVAGANGAAFANAVFRNGKPLTIGALISSNWLSTTFPTMAMAYDFGYVGCVVEAVGESQAAPIAVPADTARRLIDRVLADGARRQARAGS